MNGSDVIHNVCVMTTRRTTTILTKLTKFADFVGVPKFKHNVQNPLNVLHSLCNTPYRLNINWDFKYLPRTY